MGNSYLDNFQRIEHTVFCKISTISKIHLTTLILYITVLNMLFLKDGIIVGLISISAFSPSTFCVSFCFAARTTLYFLYFECLLTLPLTLQIFLGFYSDFISFYLQSVYWYGLFSSINQQQCHFHWNTSFLV